MTDFAINFFLRTGTAAQMATTLMPNPPTPTVGPNVAYFFYQQDTGNLYSWNYTTRVWVLVTGGGGGGGSVTSVGLALPSSVFSISGSPVTSAGTLTGSFVTQTANTVFAGPSSGVPGLPTFRALATADLPAGVGTVSSVGLADGSSTPIYNISGSPVTTTGTLNFTLKTQNANLVFAGPTSGGAAQPGFRALVSADLPGGTGTVSSIAGDGVYVTTSPNPITATGTVNLTAMAQDGVIASLQRSFEDSGFLMPGDKPGMTIRLQPSEWANTPDHFPGVSPPRPGQMLVMTGPRSFGAGTITTPIIDSQSSVGNVAGEAVNVRFTGDLSAFTGGIFAFDDESTFSNFAGAYYSFSCLTNFTGTDAGGGKNLIGFNSNPTYSGHATSGSGSECQALNFNPIFSGTGTLDFLNAAAGVFTIQSGTVTTASGFRVVGQALGGTITNAYGHYVYNNINGGAITNWYAFFDDVDFGPSAATNSHGFYQAATNHPNLFASTLELSYITASTLAYYDASKILRSVTIGSGLSFSSGTLSATSSGGTVTSVTADGTILTTSPSPITTTGSVNPTAMTNAEVLLGVHWAFGGI